MRKNVLITGASRGIGAAIATTFAQNGYNLALAARNSEALDKLADCLSKTNVDIYHSSADFSDYKSATNYIQNAIKHLGNIDILINNAGISYEGLFQEMTIEDIDKVIKNNLYSVINTCHILTPYMIKEKCGTIINISSIWGEYGASCEVIYSASKGAINAFTKALAKELAPSNITVNAVAPGIIDTSMNDFLTKEQKQEIELEIPVGRMGTPIEVAKLVYSLANQSPYITGQIITIDGGWM